MTSVAVVAAGLALGVSFLPRVIGADGQITLRGDGHAAALSVPEGWRTVQTWLTPGQATITTPDGGLTIDVGLVSTGREVTYAALGMPLGLGVEHSKRERLTSGLDAIHAEREKASGDVLVAAIGADSSGVSVALTATMPDAQVYRDALSLVVDGIRITG